MNLFFLRHGKAHPRSVKWRPDSRRPLTREGKEQMFEAARGLRAMEVSFDIILSSPFIRASRTAEILAKVYDSSKVHEIKSLAPDRPGNEIIDEINGNFSDAGNIVLVGHEPSMSRLISTLLTGDGGLKLDLKKAGLCKLEAGRLLFGKCACLQWLLTPKHLARMARK